MVFKGKPVPAALNTIRILRLLSDQPAPMNLTQVAKALSMVPSSCFNVLQTLAREGIVAFDPRRKEYTIGYGVMDLVKGAAVIGRDIHLVRPLMEAIAQRHNVTVSLWRLITRDQLMLVQTAFGSGNMRIHISIGQRSPVLSGSAGKVAAAFLDLTPRELRALFRQVRWARPPTFEVFKSQVAEVRRKGWSSDKGLLITGTASISVPIFGSDGQLHLIFGATMLVDRYNEALASRIATDLLDASRKIARLQPTV